MHLRAPPRSGRQPWARAALGGMAVGPLTQKQGQGDGAGLAHRAVSPGLLGWHPCTAGVLWQWGPAPNGFAETSGLHEMGPREALRRTEQIEELKEMSQNVGPPGSKAPQAEGTQCWSPQDLLWTPGQWVPHSSLPTDTGVWVSCRGPGHSSWLSGAEPGPQVPTWPGANAPAPAAPPLLPGNSLQLLPRPLPKPCAQGQAGPMGPPYPY